MKVTWTSVSSTDPTLGTNYSTGSIPANGDDLYIQAIPGLALANIAAGDLSAVALASFNLNMSYTGTIGDATAPGGYLRVGSAIFNLGIAPADGSAQVGSPRVKLDAGSTAGVVNVLNTASNSLDTGYEPVDMIGTALTTINVLAGLFGLAQRAPSEVSTVATVNASGGTCNLGPGVTWTTANVAGGANFSSNSGATMVNVSQTGVATLNGTGLVGTINNAGTVNHNIRNGGVGTTTLNAYGTTNFAGAPANVTVTTVNRYQGSVIQRNPANPAHVTITNNNFILCGTDTAS